MIFPLRHLVFGLGLTAAGGVAVWSSFHPGGRGEAAKAEAPIRPAPVHRFMDGPVRPLPLNPSHQAAMGPPGASEEVVPGVVLTSGVRPATDPPVAFQPTREELEFRALMVEQQANKQLKNLLGVLNLTEDQQDRIFSTLARHSDYYHPALQFQNAAGGEISVVPATAPLTSAPQPAVSPPAASPATPGPAADPIVAELAPDQVEVYERYRSERDSFWTGVVTDIEKNLNTNGQ